MMKLVHISDLHLGKSVETERRAIALRDAVMATDDHHVVVTGDITHGGRIAELASFWRIFAPLAAHDRITVVPGNHDRLGDDVADAIQAGPRVSVRELPGLYLVCFDSTGPHNRSWLSGHGVMTEDDVLQIAAAVARAPLRTVVAVLLHHHVLPLPADHAAERLVSWLGWPYCDELEQGRALVVALRGRCDVILHGHRHTPRSARLFQDDLRPLHICNAGSSTQLGHVRVFAHQHGRLIGEPTWLSAGGTIHDELPQLLRAGGPRVRRGEQRQQAERSGDSA